MAEASRARFVELCAKKQIKARGREDIRPQLSSSLSQLMPLYLKICGALRHKGGDKTVTSRSVMPSSEEITISLRAARFCKQFVSFSLENADPHASTNRVDPSETASACLRMLCQVFENEATRALLLDELLELQAFLTQRRAEASSDGLRHIELLTLACRHRTMPGSLGVDEYAVDAVLEAVDNPHVRHLILLQSSPKYFARQQQAAFHPPRTFQAPGIPHPSLGVSLGLSPPPHHSVFN
ncbi:MAG: hypothetical protein SGPRY_005823 [Prymnesium sp.]